MTPKEYKQYADLYGTDVIINSAFKDFYFVSYCEKSIPKEGSSGYFTNKVKEFNASHILENNILINGIICHKNESITIKTNIGNYRFWK